MENVNIIHLTFTLVLLIQLINSIHAASSVLMSTPFDNFRVECPQGAGAQRLAIRMIESQGLKRQDAVYTLSCNPIDELYVWPGGNKPPDVHDMEREDCHYSGAFDPIIDNNINATCSNREYMTGIVRLSDTRVQVQCCRMRSRDEGICTETTFSKPFGSEAQIESNTKLINSISIRNNQFLVRFCDLIPRPFERILADIKIIKTSTAASITETTSLTTTPTPITTTIEEKEMITENLQPKRVIKISQKSLLSRKGNWSTTIKPSTSKINEDFNVTKGLTEETLLSATTATIMKIENENAKLVNRNEVRDENNVEIENENDELLKLDNIPPLHNVKHADNIDKGQMKEVIRETEEKKLTISTDNTSTTSTTLITSHSPTLLISTEFKRKLPKESSSINVDNEANEISNTNSILMKDATIENTTSKILEKNITIFELTTSEIKSNTKAIVTDKVALETSTETTSTRISTSSHTPEELIVEGENTTKALNDLDDPDGDVKLAKMLDEMLRERSEAAKRPKAAGLPQIRESQNHVDENKKVLVKLRELNHHHYSNEPLPDSVEKVGRQFLESNKKSEDIDYYDQESTTEKETSHFPSTSESTSAIPSTFSLADQGIEKVISKPPIRRKLPQTFGSNDQKINKQNQNNNEQSNSSFNTNNDDTTTKPAHFEVLSDAKTLPPIHAFPSPPSNGRAVSRRVRPSPRPLMEWQAATATSESPSSTNAQADKKRTSTTKSRKIYADNDDNEPITKSVESNERGVNVDIKSMQKIISISTRFPPATPLPYYKRKKLTTRFEFEADDSTESTTIRSITIRTSRRTARPQNRHQTPEPTIVGPNGPYVDEETNESPFDYGINGQPRIALPSQYSRRQREKELAAAGADARAASDAALEAEIAAYEAKLSQRKRQKLAQDVDEISSSSRGRSRFERPNARFDKQGPFEHSAEIRRSPSHKENEETSLHDIRQQILERQIARRELKKLRTTTSEYIPETVESIDELASKSASDIHKEISEQRLAHSESHSRMMSRDGARQFAPRDNKPVEMPDIIVYDTLDAKNLPWAVKEAHKKQHKSERVTVNDLVPMNENKDIDRESVERTTTGTQQADEHSEDRADNIENEKSPISSYSESINYNENKQQQQQSIDQQQVDFTLDKYLTQSTLIPTTTTSTNTTTYTTVKIDLTTTPNEDEGFWSVSTTRKTSPMTPLYDPTKFYYVQKRKNRPALFEERILTFCSKETAIRDVNNLIIACGADDGLWYPNRCPPSTACFAASDSTYHICCPVASG